MAVIASKTYNVAKELKAGDNNGSQETPATPSVSNHVGTIILTDGGRPKRP